MGLRDRLVGLAREAPVPVFTLVGVGGQDVLDALRLHERIDVLDSPRSADVLVIAGRLTEALLPAALTVHDQMSRPRAVVQCLPDGASDRLARAFPPVRSVEDVEDLAGAVLDCHARLLAGSLPSSPDRYPDVPPSPWRGVGPYGQGGKGMTGGAPYGRPLPGRAPDRDGLELDQILVRVGPALPATPAGLVLHVRLQGDVVQTVERVQNAFHPLPGVVAADRRGADPSLRALRGPVPVAEVERARARHHLRALANAVRLAGLPSLGARILAMSRRVEPADRGAVAALGRMLARTGGLGWATAGVGEIRDEMFPPGWSGPAARAAGRPDDVRSGDPTYLALGFGPIVQDAGDARARWRQWLEEAVQSLGLAARAGDRRTTRAGAVEMPRGRLDRRSTPSAVMLPLLPRILEGLEWGDAVTTLASLDLDAEEAALAPERRPQERAA